MFGRKKKQKPDFIETVSARSTILSIGDSQAGLDFLVGFFAVVRPHRGHRDAAANLGAVTTILRQRPIVLSNLQNAVLSQLIHTDISTAVMESGMPVGRGFWQEFFARLRHKLLPPLQPENDFLYVLNRVFFRYNDYIWVEDIPRADWIAFFECLGLSLHIDDQRILDQLLHSLNTLSFQVAQLGLEKEVLHYIPEQYRDENPFVAQSYLVHDLQQGADTTTDIKDRIAWCFECIDHIRENHSSYGASLHQSYILLLLVNRLERMTILLDLLDGDQQLQKRSTGPLAEDPAFAVQQADAKLQNSVDILNTGKFVDFFRMLIRNENRKNSIFEFASQSAWYLAYQIAEHKGAKGDKYITSTWAEYRAMLGTAMGGGAWICLVVLIKNLLTKIPMAIFWHGFAYSVNYSLGFIAIEETHTTLATKQPAFTASAVAGSLDAKKNANQPNMYNLAVTVAKVSRSQIASFVGNLLIVFPGVWLLAWGYHELFGHKLVEGAAAMKLLEDQHPWHSLSLLYACNTGVFLFLSGIIAGYVQNKIKYGAISRRLQTHPILRLSMPKKRLARLADYVENHAGALAGNICLGFFLGMAGFIGEIFGNHFDIRHITISAGNTSLAVYGLGFAAIPPAYLATVIAGVLGIGVLNFLSSFSLAFFVAVRSRGIRLHEYPEFLGILWRYFKSAPLDFIRPRRRLEVVE
jgi:site-specific recombinase